MKANIRYLAATSLCLVAGSAIAADGYYSSQSNGGYSSSVSNGYQTNATATGYQTNTSQERYHHQEKHHHKKEKNKFSLSINVPGPAPQPPIIIADHGGRHHYREPQWVSMSTGYPLPSDAVVGGGQSNPPATLFVCRAFYHGGLHPGKLYEGRCNIGWGGNEISEHRYDVLVSRAPLHWEGASYGQIPPGAIQGGYQHDGPLFICAAEYRDGRHIGKVVGQSCNFGWGGREISIPYYQVLVR